jgi:hypothetical protein
LILSRDREEAVGKSTAEHHDGLTPDPAGRSTHHPTRNTFITSSPRWLMTFTAIRPDFGLSKGREVSLFRVAQASSLTSALSVVLSDLYGSFAPRK